MSDESAGLDKPLCTVTFLVAGSRVIEPSIVGERAYLIRNRASSHAIEVRLEGGEVAGHVPDAESAQLAPLLDGGGAHKAEITGMSKREGRLTPEITVAVYALGTNAQGAVYEQDVPARPGSSPVALVAVILVLLFGAFFALKPAPQTPAPRATFAPPAPTAQPPAPSIDAASPAVPEGYERVRGYTRKDGTHVEPYLRRKRK